MRVSVHVTRLSIHNFHVSVMSTVCNVQLKLAAKYNSRLLNRQATADPTRLGTQTTIQPTAFEYQTKPAFASAELKVALEFGNAVQNSCFSGSCVCRPILAWKEPHGFSRYAFFSHDA